ncbi:hypothetical protein OC25_22360 [Pedobacter kyungheensis]|uniref:Uncharacterized protein n=1 Tax=Pedobacter kyungheensis TaxID=1069985 RepID=A0A0C1FHH3_9SPHI|nr:hypothetical protein [Pedobacter kyungheensis]KIA91218.1 hypothetical protein OC25_22360 [Pedobacter kyungheensis]
MKLYLVTFAFLFAVNIANAQKKPSRLEKPNPISKASFNGNTCDILVAQLVDPKDFKAVGLSGINAADMLKPKIDKSVGIDVSLKEDAEVMNLTTFFKYYEVPVENQGLIKVNSSALKIMENFLASKTMIRKVELGKDETGKLFANIITLNNKKK